MGLTEEEAYSSVRFSFSVLNTPEEASRAADLVAEIYYNLRRFGRQPDRERTAKAES